MLKYFAGYKFTQLTLHFEPLAFDLEPDATTLGGGGVSNGNYEWRRYCTWDTEPRLETLALDGYSLAFAEGSGNTSGTSNPADPADPGGRRRFPAEVGKPIVKADLVVKWHMVPCDWVETPNRIPHKILKGLGKVNRYTFGGTGASFAAPDGVFLEYPPGTLHFTACKLQRFPNPTYHAGTQASLTLGRESKFVFDVEFYFSYFNPPKGRHNNAPIADNLGHNNFLWRGAQNENTGALVTGDLNAGKWFLATYSGSPEPGEARLLDPFNYAMLFDSWQNNMLPDKDG